MIGMILIDPRGVIVDGDAGAAALVGWSIDELIGRPVIELVPEADRVAHADAIARYLQAPMARALGRPGRPARVRHRDGRELELVIRLSPLAGDEPRIAVVALDPDREDATTTRQRSERHLSAAQRITHCGSWELDLSDLGDINRNSLRWSDEVFRIFGHEPGAIAVTNAVFFAAVHPDDRAAIAAAAQHTLATGAPYSVDHRVIRPDGSIRIVHEESEIQYDPDGRPALMIGTVQDVTERRLAEAALRRAEHAAVLADRMASVGLVAAGVAHEINNPLAAVMMGLDLLAARIRGGKPFALDVLDDARAGLDRVREIVRDLRVFSRDDPDHRIPVDVVRVLSSTLRMASGQIRERARLVTRFIAVPPVLATEARLGQVFLNLLLNATQAIGAGSEPEANEIAVATGTDAAGRVVVTITDTGGGIPPELQQKIFTPFFTTKDVGVGTGLGLSICHRIITGLGGDIEFSSTVGRGTEFRVILPPSDGRLASDSGHLPVERPRRRARILVIDDEPAITSHLTQILGAHHEIVAVNSAAEALAAITGGDRFDVILCDLMMPRMTGMELHAALAQVAPDQAGHLVAMTGGAFSPEAKDFLATGVPSIEKPFDFARVDAVIASLLAG